MHVCVIWMRDTVGYISFEPIEKYYVVVTSACVRRPGAAARVERRRRERAAAPVLLAHAQHTEPMGENVGTRRLRLVRARMCEHTLALLRILVRA